MCEIWELVDKDKKKTGVMHTRNSGNKIPEGMYFTSIEIWVKDMSGNILLTQRHPNKKRGLMWECTGGGVIAGETSLEGAIRELNEETGIVASSDRVVYLGDFWKNDYVLESYLFLIDDVQPTVNMQPEEVVDYRWVPENNMESMQEVMVYSIWKRFCMYRNKIKETR